MKCSDVTEFTQLPLEGLNECFPVWLSFLCFKTEGPMRSWLGFLKWSIFGSKTRLSVRYFAPKSPFVSWTEESWLSRLTELLS